MLCGTGPATAVAFILNLRNTPFPLVMRLKSKRAVDELIDALKHHRDDVFGAAERN